MKILRGLFTIVCFCVLNEGIGQGRVMEALKTENGAVVVDGNLIEDVWWQGEWTKGFTLLGKITKLPQAQTLFKIAYDENYLYFAARVEDPCINKLKVKEFHGDGLIEEDDAIELMIAPYGDQYDYYVFATNTIGTQLDEHRSLGGLLYKLDWNADWEVATKVGAKDWTVEMVIPFAELGLDERSLENWKVNVARYRQAGERIEYSSYMPVVEGLNEPENFAEIKFPSEIVKKYLWDVEGPYECFWEVDKGVDWIRGRNFIT